MNLIVRRLLEGEIPMEQFLPLFRENEDMKKYISSLIPDEAKENREHSFWENVDYDVLQEIGFDPYKLFMSFMRFDGTIGDSLNLSSFLYKLCRYHDPNIKYTYLYEDMFDLYLDAIRECFGGPEVEPYIEQIIRKNVSIRPKTTRKKITKEMISSLFHISDKKYPRWIQGAEWPKGQNSPMEFIYQKKAKDSIIYIFRDFETGEEHAVQQFY